MKNYCLIALIVCSLCVHFTSGRMYFMKKNDDESVLVTFEEVTEKSNKESDGSWLDWLLGTPEPEHFDDDHANTDEELQKQKAIALGLKECCTEDAANWTDWMDWVLKESDPVLSNTDNDGAVDIQVINFEEVPMSMVKNTKNAEKNNEEEFNQNLPIVIEIVPMETVSEIQRNESNPGPNYEAYQFK